MYLGPIDTSCISYFGHTSKNPATLGTPVFNIAGGEHTLDELATAAAMALSKGEQFVKFGYVSITPNYIFTMIGIAMREGRFCDELSDSGQDHQFNPDIPTPGAHWKAACAMRKIAESRSALAASMRESDSLFDRLVSYLVDSGANRISRQAGQLARALA